MQIKPFRYLKQPLMIPISARKYELVEDYECYWNDGGVVHRLRIPKGNVSDGASIPRMFWGLIGLRPDGLIRAGALIHDYLYAYKGVLPTGVHGTYEGDFQDFMKDYWRPKKAGMPVMAAFEHNSTRFTRKDADHILKQLATDADMKRVRVWIIYIAVRIGGYLSWPE